MTDSGGFQVFSLDSLRKVTEEGVLFHSHLNGDAHFFSPESTVDVQLAFGSDVMMVLDECLPYPVTHEKALESMHRTIRWAKVGYAHYLRREKGLHCALFPIVQGSMFPDLRKACAEALLELDAPGYAIGGLSVGEPRDLSQEMTAVTVPLLPKDRPRYVMGVGMPDELPHYVAQRRRHDGLRVADPQRPERILVHLRGQGGDQAGAICGRCRPGGPGMSTAIRAGISRERIFAIYSWPEEILFSTLATLHNIRYYLDIMRRIRQSYSARGIPRVSAVDPVGLHSRDSCVR